MRLARNEIDNAMRLRQLLLSAKGPLLDLAPTPAEETIRRLGPDLPAQLKRKMDIMNAHWEDYKRLFTTPNP
jgi:aromatic ring-opening dioxygenase catalytic subunit (LigB family)